MPSKTLRTPKYKIAICFSGGGMRATFFHLGVIRHLRSIGRLQDVQCVFSVSGGSITAAHLLKNWSLFNGAPEEFEKAASELTRFGRRDVRGRIVRRWPTTFLRSMFPRGLWGVFRTSTDLLAAEYERLFGSARFSDLYEGVPPGEQCDLYVLSTRMHDGQSCIMSRHGVVLDRSDVISADLRVSLAVACSSAFPPMFAPMTIDSQTVPSLGSSVYALTDGGVFDNLGYETAASVIAEKYKAIGEIIVSDASGPLDYGTNKTFWWYIGRLTRVTDILMNTISSKTTAKLSTKLRSIRITRVSINDRFPATTEPHLPDVVQQFAPYIRTDLDEFSDSEISALVCHGCGVAAKVQAGQQLKSGVLPPDLGYYPRWQRPIGEDDNPIKHSDRSKARLFAWWDLASYPVPIVIAIFTIYLGGTALLVSNFEDATANNARTEAARDKQLQDAINKSRTLEQQVQDLGKIVADQFELQTQIECRNPANGIERYQNSVLVTRVSDWRGGGHSQPEFCNEVIRELEINSPPNSVIQIVNSSERSRDTCAPFRCISYEYSCTVNVNTDPVYNIDPRPECQPSGAGGAP